jgi:ribose transport system substrate-binding protein
MPTSEPIGPKPLRPRRNAYVTSKKPKSALLAVALLVAACGGTGTATTAPSAGAPSSGTADCTPVTGDDIPIGFAEVTLQSPFYVELVEAAQAEAEALGYDMTMLDANGDVAKQNKDVQDLITKGIKALILNPANPEAVQPSIDAAKAEGIKVITVDRPVASGADVHVGRDNVKMGQVVGEEANRLLASGGKVIEIQGDAGGIVMQNRRDGFEGAIAGSSSINLVQGPYAEYIRANAVKAMQDLLTANPDVKLVYSHNDDMSLGAAQVMDAAGVSGVYVTGVDGLMESLRMMAEGKYHATSLNDPQYLGRLTVQAADRLLKCQATAATIDAGTTLVTPENVDGFLGDTLFAKYEPEIDWATGQPKP